MTNLKSVDNNGITTRDILTMCNRANSVINQIKLIILTTVPYILPLIETKFGIRDISSHHRNFMFATDDDRADLTAALARSLPAALAHSLPVAHCLQHWLAHCLQHWLTHCLKYLHDLESNTSSVSACYFLVTFPSNYICVLYGL